MKKTDFLVIGSGIAGLTFSLDVCKRAKVTVICKSNPSGGNTKYAQGGIASVSDSGDSFSDHIEDTINAGGNLCKPEVVNEIISDGPDAINHLIDLGTNFDLDNKGSFELGKEGGHTFRRILHFGDTTGAEIQRALISRAEAEPNIEILPYRIALDFIQNKDLSNETKNGNQIVGCYFFNLQTNKVEAISSKVCFLATGGLGKVYLYTSNPDLATGDGVAMAYRAGAELRNMEFIQFHPTCFHHPHAKNFLITEAMRGEGAKLVKQDGSEFLKSYHPMGELAPRDIVARAIDSELKSSGDDFVYLDITHLEQDYLKQRFPSIYKNLLRYGVDITKDKIPVVPAAHYSCGGVYTDLDARTSLPSLYAAGEVACSGLHGANRLASNSLLEAVVLSRRAAVHALKEFNYFEDKQHQDLPPWKNTASAKTDQQVLVSHIWDEARRTMWNLVGIVRTIDRLKLAEKRIDASLKEIENFYWKNQINSDLIELRNILIVSKLIISSALFRKESRGLHYLEEYPKHDKQLDLRDTIVKKSDKTGDICIKLEQN